MKKGQRSAKKHLSVRNAEKTKELLLKAAADLFSKNIFEHVSTREISKKAGVDAALINRYFGSKKKLFMTVLDSYIPYFRVKSTADSVRSNLYIYLKEFLNFDLPSIQVSIVRFFYYAGFSPSMGGDFAKVYEREIVFPLVEAFGENGLLKARLALAYISGVIIFFRFDASQKGSKEETDCILKQYETLLENLDKMC